MVPVYESQEEIVKAKKVKPIQKDGTYSDEKTVKVDRRNRRRLCKYLQVL